MELDFVSRLLFPAPPSSYTVDSFPGELLWIPRRGLEPENAVPEHCIPGVLLRCQTARFLVIYLHGNGEDLGRSHPFLLEMRDRFLVHVLAVEYPGYGICPGAKCDEKGAIESALTALDFAMQVLRWPAEHIIVMGRSIGTGLAMKVALKHAVKGLCLISPFLSVKQLIQDHLGPLAYMLEERFPNDDLMPLIRCSCLVVHGEHDRMIPSRHGVELYKACCSRKQLLLLPDMDHNANLFQNYLDFAEPMLKFFALQSCVLEEMQVPSWAFDKRLSPFNVSDADPFTDLKLKVPDRQGKWYLAAKAAEFVAEQGSIFSCSCSCARKPDELLLTDLDESKRIVSFDGGPLTEEALNMTVPDDPHWMKPPPLPQPQKTPVKRASGGPVHEV